jgi:hypothetical protein
MEVAWSDYGIRVNFQSAVKAVVKEKPRFYAKVNNTEVKLVRKKSEPKKEESEFKTFQVIPHASVKNNKVDQLPDIMVETYRELFERWNGGKLSSPERLFFETVITNKSYQTFITTNDDLCDIVKQQTQMTWKDVTLQDQEEKHSLDPESSIAFNFKLKYPFFMSLKTDRSMQQIPLEELLEVSRFMKANDQAFIQFGFQAAEESWYKDADKDREEFEVKPHKRWKKKEFHKSTELKPSHPGFDFVLRVIVQSKDEKRKRQIARGIILALKQLNQDNELREKQIKPSKMKRFIEDTERRRIPVPFLFGKRQILTPPEIAHFIKLPQRALQDEYPIVETVTGRETDIPDALKKGGIAL